MDIKFSVLVLLISFFVLFGCVQPVVCGDGVCSNSESSNTCVQDCGEDEVFLRTTWKSAEPFAINDWAKTDGLMVLVLKNNSFENIVLEGVQLSLDDYKYDLNYSISPGATLNVDIVSSACLPTENYFYSKMDIVISYSSEGISNKKQFGIADIAGSCN